MPSLRTALLTVLAMLAFAGNSLLCRAALAHTDIDAASFTSIRMASGALVLWLLVRGRGAQAADRGSWGSALALLGYAAGFSLAYASLSAATGALLLFSAVQVTMIGHALWRGERLSLLQSAGLATACAGLAWLLLPGVEAPPLSGAVMMLGAGLAWGIYSLRGRAMGDPVAVTAGNFLRAVPMALLLNLVLLQQASLDLHGVILAAVSGALASGLGYAIWYAALPRLSATSAATVQLSVPVIAAGGGVLLLGESAGPRLLLASAAILGGIALVTLAKPRDRLRTASSPPRERG